MVTDQQGRNCEGNSSSAHRSAFDFRKRRSVIAGHELVEHRKERSPLKRLPQCLQKSVDVVLARRCQNERRRRQPQHRDERVQKRRLVWDMFPASGRQESHTWELVIVCLRTKLFGVPKRLRKMSTPTGLPSVSSTDDSMEPISFTRQLSA